MMITSLRIVRRSWQLPWQEKRLLVLPVFLFTALYSTEYLANSLGMSMNPRNLDKGIHTVIGYPVFEFLDAIIYTLVGATSIAISLCSLNENEIKLSQIQADLRLRFRTLIAFALLIQFIFFVFSLSWIRIQLFPPSWHLLENELFALLWLLLAKIPFIFTLPILVNEKGRFLHLLRRSWRYNSANADIILRSLPGLLFTFAPLLVVRIVLDGVFFSLVREPTILLAFYGLLARNYEILIALPVCWSYQALLYQHARDPEPS